MLSLELIVNETERVRAGLARRGEMSPPLDEIVSLDTRRRELIKEADALRARRNEVSKSIGDAKRKPSPEEVNEMRSAGNRIKEIDADQAQVKARLDEILLTLPNLPLPETPDGLDDKSNVIVRSHGEPREISGALAHWDLGPKLGILDMEAGASLSGARFGLFRGKGARLHRALSAWMLDVHTEKNGYTEIDPPYMVKPETMVGSGNLPKFRDNLYHDDESNLWLIPTAEVALNGLHQGQIIDPGALPLKYVALTPSFRKEHTAAGRDVRGIKRVHQFHKVEIFRYTEPEQSAAALEEMIDEVCSMVGQLGLAYRVVALCAGDMGFQAARTFDIEVWSPGTGEWMEVSSISTCTDFQARRNNTRYRPAVGASTRLPHTLNGSGLPPGRIWIAVVENGQQLDGSVVIPEVLRPYTGFDRIG